MNMRLLFFNACSPVIFRVGKGSLIADRYAKFNSNCLGHEQKGELMRVAF